MSHLICNFKAPLKTRYDWSSSAFSSVKLRNDMTSCYVPEQSPCLIPSSDVNTFKHEETTEGNEGCRMFQNVLECRKTWRLRSRTVSDVSRMFYFSSKGLALFQYIFSSIWVILNQNKCIDIPKT